MSTVMECANCGGPCGGVEGWSDEDAMREAEENFPGLAEAPEERVVVCDDCYRVLSARIEQELGPRPWPVRLESSPW